MKRLPKGTQCDAMFPVYPEDRDPHLRRCVNLATKEVPQPPLPWPAYLCDSCAESREKK